MSLFFPVGWQKKRSERNQRDTIKILIMIVSVFLCKELNASSGIREKKVGLELNVLDESALDFVSLSLSSSSVGHMNAAGIGREGRRHAVRDW